jgi:hypothetical protein
LHPFIDNLLLFRFILSAETLSFAKKVKDSKIKAQMRNDFPETDYQCTYIGIFQGRA